MSDNRTAETQLTTIAHREQHVQHAHNRTATVARAFFTQNIIHYVRILFRNSQKDKEYVLKI
jgi:hypothetical protein